MPSPTLPAPLLSSDEIQPCHLEASSIATVRLLTGIDKPLSYSIPKSIRQEVFIGSLVWVPLGPRRSLAVVQKWGMSDSRFPASQLKPLIAPVYPFPVLTSDLILLAQWMQVYYAAGQDRILEAMIPAAVRRGMGLKQVALLSLKKRLNPDELKVLCRRAPQQAALYTFIVEQTQREFIPRDEAMREAKVSSQICKALVQKEILEETSQTADKIAYADDLGNSEVASTQHWTLSTGQQTAVNNILDLLKEKDFRTHLVHGITGSGKTEVYLQAIKQTLDAGGSALFLVPEVALTPQTLSRLRARLQKEHGVQTLLWHSRLSDGERLHAWHALVTGQARVVVGARSAVFAPLRNLRLIIVDEEHEPAYKQDEVPRYHGRDVAVYRAKLCRAVCVLGSATPALESLYNVQNGKYTLSRMNQRIDDRELPLIHVVNMTREVMGGGGSTPILSRLLIDKTLDRLEKGEQVILFLNRRGHSTSMLCQECGWAALCEHCSVTLTWHRTDNQLHCHLCGESYRAHKACPECNSKKIHWRGFGTQRIEEQLKKQFSTARIARLDADVVRRKDAFREILGDFRRGKLDLLIGTQMIAKGLDFPNVTLVGLISADLSLHTPDFRAAERTFQLVVQVAGRAGRGDRAGEVVLQSFQPDSDPIQFARHGDFDGFLKEELLRRKRYNYPPYRRLIQHLFRGRNPDKVGFYAEQWVAFLKTTIEQKGLCSDMEIRGPAPAPLEKIKDYYRYQVWYFSPQVSRTIVELQSIRHHFKREAEVIDVLDVDPMDLS